ncbi:hypothetical protein YTPLAS18_34330 [Nitrospira sp.]|nr:hypothetical protein YTPLAS18_34330 [Nitrospira sp.]
MKLTGHEAGILREYMSDLVEQARQEDEAQRTFGFTAPPYRPDQAISDLLAILDDRVESEGLQVGLPEGFLHRMWTFCNEASNAVCQQVWMESSLSADASSRSRTRELTYRTLLAFLERQDDTES